MSARFAGKRSFKWTMAVWYAAMVAVISAILFAAAVTAVMRDADERQKEYLSEAVMGAVMEIQTSPEIEKALEREDEDGLDVSFFIRGFSFLSVYTGDGEFVMGLDIFEGQQTIPFADEQVRKVKLGDEPCYLEDAELVLSDGSHIWVRGIMYRENGLKDTVLYLRSIILLVALLIILAPVSSYYLTSFFLEPIRQISDTAEEIRRSGDLNRRIDLEESGDELHRLAGTFNAMFAQLARNMEAERAFVSYASHELRTPVSVILGECEYALEDAKSREELRMCVGKIEKQGYHMARMIEMLLILTRMEQSTERYPLARCDVSELLASLREDYEIPNEKNIRIIWNIEEQLYASVNPELFRLMAGNLLQNALKYGKEDGRVEVTLRGEADEKERLVLQVEDNGIGITEADMAHIWDRFYRADGGKGRPGTGLGLALVRQIVVCHGGEVSARSREGEGSTFTVRIPMA